MLIVWFFVEIDLMDLKMKIDNSISGLQKIEKNQMSNFYVW